MKRLLAIVVVLGCPTTHKARWEKTVPAGNARLVISCATSEKCENEVWAKHDHETPKCFDGKELCRVTEISGGNSRVLLEERGVITPIVFDAKQNVFWFARDRAVFGVNTSASESPGRRVPPFGAIHFPFNEVKTTPGNIVVFSLGWTFRIWDPTTGRVVEVKAPGTDRSRFIPSEYAINDLRIGFCELENDPAILWWTTIDIPGSLNDGAPRMQSGSRAKQLGDDVTKCASALANASVVAP